MPAAIRLYVRYVEAVSRVVGRFAMYGVFAMIGLLLYSSITKSFFLPSIWTLEMAQFFMVGYFLLGGGYSMQLAAHVRMDLVYGRWSRKTRGFVDSITSFCLLFYLGVLLYGGVSSTHYALTYDEQSYSSWAPYMAPVKIVMTFGIVLMLLQAVATFFRDLAAARGLDIGVEAVEEEGSV